MLGRLLSQLGYLERQTEQYSQRIRERLQEMLPAETHELLDAIPGINRRTIENVIAEIGVDMTIFPDEHHLASWCGMCPGNEESGGRRLRSRARKGNPWLRRALVEAGWAASRTKNSYLRAQYLRIVRRRGKNRALMAVAHTLLVIIYHVLKYNVEYRDLGPNYFDQLEPQRLQRYLVKRLQNLGYEVTLSPLNPDDSAA